MHTFIHCIDELKVYTTTYVVFWGGGQQSLSFFQKKTWEKIGVFFFNVNLTNYALYPFH